MGLISSVSMSKVQSQSQSQFVFPPRNLYPPLASITNVPVGLMKMKMKMNKNKKKKKKKKKKKNKKDFGSSDSENDGLISILTFRSSSQGKREKIEKKENKDVRIREILFTPERDFLVKHNGDKVFVDDLNGKGVVLYTWDLTDTHDSSCDLNILDVYQRCKDIFEVVFVGVGNGEDEDRFNALFSTMPWPAVPFSDQQVCHHLDNTFRPDGFRLGLPFWAFFEPTDKLMFPSFYQHRFFEMYDGSELNPFTSEAYARLLLEDYKVLEKLPNCLDRLLTCPGLDYLLSTNGDQVPITCLKDKVVGLYFCENVPHPPRMESIKNVYEEAQELQYPFEIVQINIHFPWQNDVQQCNETIPWLALPFKDPRTRKLCRVFESSDPSPDWSDRLVIIARDQPNMNGTFVEFCGAEIMADFGIKAYPFTRRVICEMEYKRLKEEAKLQLIFPTGCSPPLFRPRDAGAGGGCDDQVAVTQLHGKRVLLVFGDRSACKSGELISTLKYRYFSQLQEVGEENKFEVVFMSFDKDRSSFEDCVKDMPWFVYSYSLDFASKWWTKIWPCFDSPMGAIVAFDEEGELFRKKLDLDLSYHEFPFIHEDLELEIESALAFAHHLNDDGFLESRRMQ